MRKFTIYNLQFTIFVLILYILHFTFYIPSAFALESTPSADIKAKLEEFKKEAASMGAKFIQEISRKLKDKAYVGKVKSKSETSITLATKNGPKIINLNQDTEFLSNVKNKKYSLKLVSEEDYLASLGDVDEQGVLTARRIILLPTLATAELKTYLWGQVISISDKLITLKNKEGKSAAVALPLGSNVKNLDFVILTGVKGKNDIYEAEFVYIIPQGNILKPKKTATPSARPNKTPSPSPTKRP